jgi:hypothetical protein
MLTTYNGGFIIQPIMKAFQELFLDSYAKGVLQEKVTKITLVNKYVSIVS